MTEEFNRYAEEKEAKVGMPATRLPCDNGSVYLRRAMNSREILPLILIAAAFSGLPWMRTSEIDDHLVYVGTYTGRTSKGIYAFRSQPSIGKTIPLGLAAESVNASFLAVSPDHRTLYAVNEAPVFEGGNGAVSAFAIDSKTGRLKLLNQVSSGGRDPCHLTVDESGRWLFVANYSSGSVSVCPVQDDGKLGKASAFVQHNGSGKDPQHQDGPHAHSVTLSPDGRFLLVSDLDLDKVMIYRFDVGTGALEANNPPFVKLSAGAGPRHSSFHPDGRHVYEINELNSTLTAFAYDGDRGSLREIETISTLPRDFSGDNTAAEVEAHPDGRFVYASNRGHDSIAVFAIKGDKSLLELAQFVSTEGKTPRQFAVDPTGNYLFAANQNSGNVVVFRIDRASGKLTLTNTVLKVPNPACVLFVPRGGTVDW